MNNPAASGGECSSKTLNFKTRSKFLTWAENKAAHTKSKLPSYLRFVDCFRKNKRNISSIENQLKVQPSNTSAMINLASQSSNPDAISYPILQICLDNQIRPLPFEDQFKAQPSNVFDIVIHPTSQPGLDNQIRFRHFENQMELVMIEGKETGLNEKPKTGLFL